MKQKNFTLENEISNQQTNQKIILYGIHRKKGDLNLDKTRKDKNGFLVGLITYLQFNLKPQKREDLFTYTSEHSFVNKTNEVNISLIYYFNKNKKQARLLDYTGNNFFMSFDLDSSLDEKNFDINDHVLFGYNEIRNNKQIHLLDMKPYQSLIIILNLKDPQPFYNLLNDNENNIASIKTQLFNNYIDVYSKIEQETLNISSDNPKEIIPSSKNLIHYYEFLEDIETYFNLNSNKGNNSYESNYELYAFSNMPFLEKANLIKPRR